MQTLDYGNVNGWKMDIKCNANNVSWSKGIHVNPLIWIGFDMNYVRPPWNSWNFTNPIQNDIWVQAPWLGIENTIKGKWWLPLSSGRGESCESMYVRGQFVHQKCYNYALTNLLFGLCKFMWIVDPLVTHPSPYPGILVRPFYPKSVVN
jgi:hypothetical protein